MRLEKKEIEETNSNLVLLVIAIILLLISALYFFAVGKIKKKVVNAIENVNNNYIEISYKKLKISPFPIFIKIRFYDLDVKIESKENKINLTLPEITFKNLMFTRDVNVILPKNGKLIDPRDKKMDVAFDQHYINFSLDKELKISGIDAFVKKITLKYTENAKTISDLMNITFKTIKLASDEYINTTTRFDIDKIGVKLGDSEIENESNFEIVISNLKELDSTKKVISMTNLIDTFTYNDITNNYALGLKGNFNADNLTKNLTADVELEISNYNSLVRTINNKNSYLLFDKAKISNFIQMLELAPENDKNTNSNKYYKVVVNMKTKLLLINNANINDLIKNMFYKK